MRTLIKNLLNKLLNDNPANETQNVRDTETPVSQLSFRSGSSGRASKRSRMVRSDEVLNLVANTLKSSDCLLYTSYGNHVAEELRALPKDQALFCQKLINDAMFEAKLGNLDRSSMVWNKNSSNEEQMPSTVSRPMLLQPVYPPSHPTQQYIKSRQTNIYNPNTVSQRSQYSNSQESQVYSNPHESQVSHVSSFGGNFATASHYLTSFSAQDDTQHN